MAADVYRVVSRLRTSVVRAHARNIVITRDLFQLSLRFIRGQRAHVHVYQSVFYVARCCLSTSTREAPDRESRLAGHDAADARFTSPSLQPNQAEFR
jgi:hypothetical protein